MSEKIKIVYAWIGPRGPIWNTELPNVLSFANVAEGAQTTSNNWWADDLWNRIFRTRKDLFELYAAEGLDTDDKQPYIYPYSLCWRINFENYFVGGTGLVEFSHTPGHIIQLCRTGNGHLLVDHSAEAFMNKSHIKFITGYFRDSCSIPLNRIIYLTGTMNGKELYRKYCDQYNVPDDDLNRMHVIEYPSAQSIFSGQILRGELLEPEYDTEKVPEKLFLMWNRRFRTHRIVMALGLDRLNLLDKSYISFYYQDPEAPDTTFDKIIDIAELNVNYKFTIENVDNFRKKLPLILDGETNINHMCEDRDYKSRPYYQNSLVSIITETNYNLEEVTLTEKSFKPIKEKHPFIIVGVNGVLKSLRSLGYKTFGDFWSEDYDDIQDPRKRLKRILEICEEIGNWTSDQQLDFKRKVKPILEHNWQLLKKPSSDFVIESLVDIISTNIQKNKTISNV